MANFSIALEMLKQGCTFATPSMVDYGVYVESEFIVIGENGEKIQVLVKKHSGHVIGLWTPSSTDILAKDYVIVAPDGAIIEAEMDSEEVETAEFTLKDLLHAILDFRLEHIEQDENGMRYEIVFNHNTDMLEAYFTCFIPPEYIQWSSLLPYFDTLNSAKKCIEIYGDNIKRLIFNKNLESLVK